MAYSMLQLDSYMTKHIFHAAVGHLHEQVHIQGIVWSAYNKA